MRKAALTRFDVSDQGTFGVLRFGSSTVFTLELPDRANQRSISRIPAGAYVCNWVMSPRFKRKTYLLQGVPGRDGIRIHSANFAGDVAQGWVSHLNGCIAPALYVGSLKNPKGVMQKAGLVSKPAVTLLEAWGDTKPFILEIS